MRVAPNDETREVARAAAQWLALLESGGASDEDHAQLQHWRASDTRHENAWQKILQLRQRFAGLPPTLAMATLDRPDPARRAALKRALGVAALVPAAWLISRELPLEVWRADLHTSTGERRKVQLAQDSSLQCRSACTSADTHSWRDGAQRGGRFSLYRQRALWADDRQS